MGMYKRSNKPRPLDERLWEKVVKDPSPDGCWIFMGAKSSFGHGIIANADGTRWRAHRLSWELTNGPIPDGMLVLHHCDVPPCVRPDHLFLGTQTDNMSDCVSKGRHYTPWSTHERQRHGYTDPNLKAGR